MKRPWLALAALSFSCAAPIGTLPDQDSEDNSWQAKSWSQRLSEPVSQPTIFESPVIQSQVRPMVMHTKLPTTSVFGGGNYQVFALQARYAVNDRFAIIATKDGYIDFNPKAGVDEEGFADVALGIKYAAIDDPENGFLLTPGITYEVDPRQSRRFSRQR